MRIKKLELKNFRGFEELTVDFPERESGLAVFVGVNGAGKTSILKIINYFAFYIVNYGLMEYEKIYGATREYIGNTFLVSRNDIKIGTEMSINEIKFEYLDIDWAINNSLEFGAIGSSCDPPIHEPDFLFDDKELEEYRPKGWTKVQLKSLVKKIELNPPCFISYFANRVANEHPSLEAKDITEINPLLIAKNNFLGNPDFDEFFEWFRNMEDFESEQLREKEDFSYRNKELELVRRAVKGIMPQFDKIRVQRQPVEDFVLEKNGVKLPTHNLSHGERSLLAIAGDIARRLVISYPNMPDPLMGKGVVLIDEIERHLHPGWQRIIIPKLRKTFPNIQFIVTTHSPQVISNVPRENVFILNNFKLEKNRPHTEGRDSNAILEDVFGVPSRPEEEKNELDLLFDAIEKNNKKEADKYYKILKEKLGERDLELKRAEDYMDVLLD